MSGVSGRFENTVTTETRESHLWREEILHHSSHKHTDLFLFRRNSLSEITEKIYRYPDVLES